MEAYRKEKPLVQVVGVFLTADTDEVLMQVKERPAWMEGNLNGPGGKLEPGETLVQAMVREFEEETGMSTGRDEWNYFLTLHCSTPSTPYSVVHYFWAINDRELDFLPFAQRASKERLMWVAIDNLANLLAQGKALHNMPWICRMAQGCARGAERANSFDLYESYVERDVD